MVFPGIVGVVSWFRSSSSLAAAPARVPATGALWDSSAWGRWPTWSFWSPPASSQPEHPLLLRRPRLRQPPVGRDAILGLAFLLEPTFSSLAPSRSHSPGRLFP
jgi:hypothetical protein